METASAQYHNPRPLPEEQQRFEPSASEVAGVLARPSSLFDGPLAEKLMETPLQDPSKAEIQGDMAQAGPYSGSTNLPSLGSDSVAAASASTATKKEEPASSKRPRFKLDGAGDFDDDAALQKQLDEVVDLLAQQPRTDGGPRRPMNAFLIFARWRRLEMAGRRLSVVSSGDGSDTDHQEGSDGGKRKSQAVMQRIAPKPSDVSAALGEEWKSLTLEQQQPFHRKANQLRAEFDARNPDYKFTRGPKGAAKKRRLERLEEKAREKRQSKEANASGSRSRKVKVKAESPSTSVDSMHFQSHSLGHTHGHGGSHPYSKQFNSEWGMAVHDQGQEPRDYTMDAHAHAHAYSNYPQHHGHGHAYGHAPSSIDVSTSSMDASTFHKLTRRSYPMLPGSYAHPHSHSHSRSPQMTGQYRRASDNAGLAGSASGSGSSAGASSRLASSFAYGNSGYGYPGVGAGPGGGPHGHGHQHQHAEMYRNAEMAQMGMHSTYSALPPPRSGAGAGVGHENASYSWNIGGHHGHHAGSGGGMAAYGGFNSGYNSGNMFAYAPQGGMASQEPTSTGASASASASAGGATANTSSSTAAAQGISPEASAAAGASGSGGGGGPSAGPASSSASASNWRSVELSEPHVPQSHSEQPSAGMDSSSASATATGAAAASPGATARTYYVAGSQYSPPTLSAVLYPGQDAVRSVAGYPLYTPSAGEHGAAQGQHQQQQHFWNAETQQYEPQPQSQQAQAQTQQQQHAGTASLESTGAPSARSEVRLAAPSLPQTAASATQQQQQPHPSQQQQQQTSSSLADALSHHAQRAQQQHQYQYQYAPHAGHLQRYQAVYPHAQAHPHQQQQGHHLGEVPASFPGDTREAGTGARPTTAHGLALVDGRRHTIADPTGIGQVMGMGSGSAHGYGSGLEHAMIQGVAAAQGQEQAHEPNPVRNEAQNQGHNQEDVPTRLVEEHTQLQDSTKTVAQAQGQGHSHQREQGLQSQYGSGRLQEHEQSQAQRRVSQLHGPQLRRPLPRRPSRLRQLQEAGQQPEIWDTQTAKANESSSSSGSLRAARGPEHASAPAEEPELASWAGTKTNAEKPGAKPEQAQARAQATAQALTPTHEEEKGSGGSSSSSEEGQGNESEDIASSEGESESDSEDGDVDDEQDEDYEEGDGSGETHEAGVQQEGEDEEDEEDKIVLPGRRIKVRLGAGVEAAKAAAGPSGVGPSVEKGQGSSR